MTTTNLTSRPVPARTPKRQGRIRLQEQFAMPKRPLARIQRGRQILIDLNRYRFLTNQQVANLHFVGKQNQHKKIYTAAGAKDAADLSVRLLWESGLLERMMVFQTPPNSGSGRPCLAPVNSLTRKGANLVRTFLEEEGDRTGGRWSSRLAQFADQSIDHILEINNVAIALRRSAGAVGGVTLFEWFDDEQLTSLTKRRQTRFRGFVPDGFSLVEVITGSGPRLVPLFWEIDRGTETVDSHGRSHRDWYSKIVRYGEYFTIDFRHDPFLTGALRMTPDELKILDTPRVLTITTNQRRVELMVAATARAEGRGTYLYTTREHLFAADNILAEPVWRSPILPAGKQAALIEQIAR